MNKKIMDNILYIDDEQVNLDVFEATFQFNYNIFTAGNTKEAVSILKKNDILVVITDQRMPGETGIDFINRVQDQFPNVVFMILSGYSDFEVVIRAIKLGNVYRFVQKPFEEKQLTIDIENAIEKYYLKQRNDNLLSSLEKQNEELRQLKQQLEEENLLLKSEMESHNTFENIVTQDKKFLSILKSIENISDSKAPVLINGQTGTGKELIARAVHNISSRSKAPFIAVNCAAIPDALFESELFGHEKGAFTGAISTKKGKFELANNGTIFLDEIGEIPVALQAKLLRVLQEGCVERVGGTKLISLDFRIICATNRNLENEISNNSFRSDLFYRLNVFPIELPPLNQRVGDIPLLVDYFIDKYNKEYNCKIVKIRQKTMALLRAYDWPGNIRELENVIERAVITSKNGNLNIPSSIFENDEKELPSYNLFDAERKHIVTVLNKTAWRVGGKGGAAELLGIPRSTLQSKMEKLGISKDKAAEISA